MKAVFLDRDGVLNEEVSHITELSQIKMIENAGRAVQLFNSLGYKTIIVTNQPSIGLGMSNEEKLKEINAHICSQLAKQGGKIDAIYFCPHHPQRGLGDYKKECECRKPNPGMLLEAAKQHSLDLKKSFMIGDRTSDIKAGYQAGCTTIVVKTGYAGDDGFKDATPDYIAENIYEAAKLIQKLEGEKHAN